MPRLSPILVNQRNPGDVNVSIVGAQSAAVGALISGAVDSGVRTLSPTLLASRSRAFGTKGGPDVSPTPVGVEVRGQTTPLFGATTVVYIDGAEAVAQAGSPGRERPVGRRSKKKKKLPFSVELDGEFIAVETAEEARALLKSQATPKARLRRKPRITARENLRPDSFDIGEVADAAIKSPEIIQMFEAAVAHQSMQALGVLKMELERVRDLPEPVFAPPEIEITQEERQLADELMGQVGLFDEVLGAFLRGISEAERNAYREMDEMLPYMARDNSAIHTWADDRITRKRKRFDAFRKVYRMK